MPKIYATISNETLLIIQKIANKNKESFSKTVNNIIINGLENNKNFEEKAPYKATKKQEEYMLRSLIISAEILRKMFDYPSKFNTKDPEEILESIKKKVEKHIHNNQETYQD